MRVTFQEELEQVEGALHEEGTLALRALRGALNALVHHDIELADEVIRFDDEVDQRYLAIEEAIQSLLDEPLDAFRVAEWTALRAAGNAA